MKQTPTPKEQTMTQQTETFKRLLRNTESQLRNRKNLTGRNAHGSQSSLNYKMQRLHELVRTDEVCDLLDSDERLAARWNRVERQHVGLPT
jgi:hypothetical protein